jgi:hypothetical protein
MLVPTSEQQWRQNTPWPALNSLVGCLARRKKTEFLRRTICRGIFLSAFDPQLEYRMLLEIGFWANERVQKARAIRL